MTPTETIMCADALDAPHRRHHPDGSRPADQEGTPLPDVQDPAHGAGVVMTEDERLIVAEAVAHVLMNGAFFCWTRWIYK